MIEPTVGRVVLFRPAGHPADAQPHSASIAFVHDPRLINVGAINENGTAYAATNVILVQDGDPIPVGVPYAEWMAYQKGQAAKADQATADLAPRLKAIEEVVQTGGPIHQTVEALHDRVSLVEAKVAGTAEAQKGTDTAAPAIGGNPPAAAGAPSAAAPAAAAAGAPQPAAEAQPAASAPGAAPQAQA